MISFPGKILKRFGRYEAVEDLGDRERSHLWRAWDPFLERFVRIADLGSLDPSELVRTLPRLDYALKLWLGGGHPEAVLDFSPGGKREPPYMVLLDRNTASAPSEEGDKPKPEQRSLASRMMGSIGYRLVGSARKRK